MIRHTDATPIPYCNIRSFSPGFQCVLERKRTRPRFVSVRFAGRFKGPGGIDLYEFIREDGKRRVCVIGYNHLKTWRLWDKIPGSENLSNIYWIESEDEKK